MTGHTGERLVVWRCPGCGSIDGNPGYCLNISLGAHGERAPLREEVEVIPVTALEEFKERLTSDEALLAVYAGGPYGLMDRFIDGGVNVSTNSHSTTVYRDILAAAIKAAEPGSGGGGS